MCYITCLIYLLKYLLSFRISGTSRTLEEPQLAQKRVPYQITQHILTHKLVIRCDDSFKDSIFKIYYSGAVMSKPTTSHMVSLPELLLCTQIACPDISELHLKLLCLPCYK